MKNYYSQLIDINTTEIRLETLYEKRAIIESKLTSCTQQTSGAAVSGSPSNDKMVRYIAELAEINEEIEVKEKELKVLRSNLKIMEKELERIKGRSGIQERIFFMRFIEGLPINEIAERIPCDISTVYRQIRKINKKMSQT